MIPTDQLEFKTNRSYSGGQQTNGPCSWVEVRHIPTGIVVSCDFERSQLKNKQVCLDMIEWALVILNINPNA